MWKSCIKPNRVGKSNSTLNQISVSSSLSSFHARSVSSERRTERANRPESPAGAGLCETNISLARTKVGKKKKKERGKEKKKRAKSLKQVEGNGFSSMISIRVTSVVVGIAHSAHSLKLLCNRQCYPEEMERLLIKCHNYGE